MAFQAYNICVLTPYKKKEQDDCLTLAMILFIYNITHIFLYSKKVYREPMIMLIYNSAYLANII